MDMDIRILLIDPDAGFTEAFHEKCESDGDIVDICGTSEEARIRITEFMPDLVVLSDNLPDGSGLELCRQLRRHRDCMRLPIIMLTERSEEAMRVRCLETGADDVLTKPVSPAELMAHVKAVIRRHSPLLVLDTLRLGGIELNRFTRRVQCMGRELRLSSIEFRLLMTLMENSGRVLPRAVLLDQVWGLDAYVGERTVDVHIARLRNCLRDTVARDAIQTVRGLGYSFVAAPGRVPPASR
jgi:two-component system phosphate regulon response regulator PhoB